MMNSSGAARMHAEDCRHHGVRSGAVLARVFKKLVTVQNILVPQQYVHPEFEAVVHSVMILVRFYYR